MSQPGTVAMVTPKPPFRDIQFTQNRGRFGGSRLRPMTLRIVLSAVLSAGVFLLSALLLVSTLR